MVARQMADTCILHPSLFPTISWYLSYADLPRDPLHSVALSFVCLLVFSLLCCCRFSFYSWALPRLFSFMVSCIIIGFCWGTKTCILLHHLADFIWGRPLLPSLLSYYHEWVLNFVICWFFFFSCNWYDHRIILFLYPMMWRITLIDFDILNQTCIFEINSWSWHMILFKHCCIQFATIFWGFLHLNLWGVLVYSFFLLIVSLSYFDNYGSTSLIGYIRMYSACIFEKKLYGFCIFFFL